MTRKNNYERGSVIQFHCDTRFGDHFAGRKKCLAPSLPLLESLCQVASFCQSITAMMGREGAISHLQLGELPRDALWQFFALGMTCSSLCAGGLIYCCPQGKYFCHWKDVCALQLSGENRKNRHRLFGL